MLNQTVFDSTVWKAGHYRIPSVIVTKRGTVVACVDGRICGGEDNPNRIDKIVRRSEDNGVTWQEVIVAAQEHGETQVHASAAIDPCMLYDPDTDRIFVTYCHTPAGVGIIDRVTSEGHRVKGCRKGTGETQDGDRWVGDGKRLCLLKDGKLWYDNQEIGLSVDEDGNVTRDGAYLCNLYLGDGNYREWETGYLYMITSGDDGKTWSAPVSLNRMVKEPYMSFIGPGPGCGIVVSKGAHRGRLIFPIYYNTASRAILMLSCAVIYSDDKGRTWKRSDAPIHSRKRCGIPFHHRFVAYSDCTTESQLIELEDGRLRIFMRNHSGKKRIATADSDDGGQTWKNFRFNDRLPQCICQCSVINIDDNGTPAIAFLNAADPSKRRNGVLRISYDSGETFRYNVLIKEGGFVYSSIVQMKDGNLGILYETSTDHTAIDFKILSLQEIKEAEQWRDCPEV